VYSGLSEKEKIKELEHQLEQMTINKHRIVNKTSSWNKLITQIIEKKIDILSFCIGISLFIGYFLLN
jgi:hypothetical protein